MNTNSQRVIANPTDPAAWRQALYAFLAEKERRSGSRRTVESCGRMLQQFFGPVGKTPDQVTSPDGLGVNRRQDIGHRSPLSVAAILPPNVAAIVDSHRHTTTNGVLI